MSEIWMPIPGYSNYAVSSEGRLWNVKHNRELTGHRGHKNRQVELRDDQGQWWKYKIEDIMSLVNFYSSPEPIMMRKVRVIDTDEVFDSVADAARALYTETSSIYKVLRGERARVSGVQVEYIYEQTGSM